MITDKELTEVSLSPTKKDYYQIWNELMDLASKISDRWTPDATNETDPGIILLKSLVAVADKLNYNIDKNTLEAFMPSATQQDSMRKLTEMMGYSMKYYRAATCKVNISFNDSNEKKLSDIGSIYFPKFVNLKNEEEDINYVTLDDFTLQSSEPSRQINAIEGELIECETNTDNIISMVHLDDSNRYILPETNVAENAVFVYNIVESNGISEESEAWKQVDNLNTQLPGAHVFKFGFDSKSNLPYIQFPDDISQLIKDGLRIKYIRTNGLTGNIAARILCKLQVPALWGTAEEGSPIRELTAEDFTIVNPMAAMNGANPESLNAAYNGYKKIIGTFDTLVTCRDYMNKIYQLTMSETDTTPLVSNAIVSDIRDDINRSVTICSFDNYGISYSDVSRIDDTTNTDAIEHFDLILYPFKTIYGLNTYDEYVNSFKINKENVNKIKYDLTDSKSIAHNFVLPKDNGTEIACIKNYLKLKAKVTTVKKVTLAEEREILSNIYTAIYKNFNCRHIDFGEEIPYDTIYEVMTSADTRIKDISLDEPILYTKIMLADATSTEELVAVENSSGELTRADKLYNKLVLRNVLAGRIAAFQYDEDFKASYADQSYPDWTGSGEGYKPKYPDKANDSITKLVSEFKVLADEINQSSEKKLVLNENEVVQFRAPNLKTTITYPAYVNYFLKRNPDGSAEDAIAATFKKAKAYLATLAVDNTLPNPQLSITKWEQFANLGGINLDEKTYANADAFDEALKNENIGAIFIKNDNYYEEKFAGEWTTPDTTYYIISFGVNASTNFTKLELYLKNDRYNAYNNNKTLEGLFRSLGADLNMVPGKYIDADYIKYMKAYTPRDLKDLYVQQTHPAGEKFVTEDGLGRDASYAYIGIDAEYQLKEGEFLLINYTDSQTDDNGNETKTIVNKYWGPGTIIKPNFKLIDSTLYHNEHSYTKTDGFYFVDYTSCPGMFTLGANDQICIREIVKVELAKAGTYLYWERNDDDLSKNTIIFDFDEYYGNGIPTTNLNKYPTGFEPNAYTLKEGEHLYYTDAKKTDLAYYGAGTLIIKTADTPVLKKNTTLGTVSEEDIMTYGITAAIPWGTAYDLSPTARNGSQIIRKLTIIENQYISLTEGDILYSIATEAGDAGTFGIDLDNNWSTKFITSATYQFAEDSDNTIPIPLPPINIEGLGWRARSRLDFNMGPETPQILHHNDKITVTTKREENPIILEPHTISDELVPLAVYSNYICQCGYDTVKITNTDFKIKLAEVNDPLLGTSTQESATVDLDNYINGDETFTKFSFESTPDELKDWDYYKVFTLNTNLLDNKFGLIMFYYIDELDGEAGHTNAHIEVETDGTTPGAGIRLFNREGQSIEPGDSVNVALQYEFKPGIQVIELRPGVTKVTLYADYTEIGGEVDKEGGTSYQSIVVFSDLSLVKAINPKLSYRYNPNSVGTTNEYKALTQILSDIQNTKVADDFYYNTPVDHGNAIDLNSNIENETMATPEVWYDPNNVNNKFVISEIDASYLTTGITLTKASKI